jgi:hypothetical protein
MAAPFQARWISKARSQLVRKKGALGDGLILNSCKGFIVLEPRSNPIGDGEVLSTEAARFELDPVWCLDSPAKVGRARRLLGLE